MLFIEIIASKGPRCGAHTVDAGISGRVYGTRKTCGSLLATLEIHPRAAMQILRHSRVAVTMEIYTEVPTAATRDALRKPMVSGLLLYFPAACIPGLTG